VSQITTAVPPPRELADSSSGSVRLRRLANAAMVGGILWALQFAVLLVYPGLSLDIHPGFLFASIGVALALIVGLALRPGGGPRIRPSTGILGGVGIAIVHLLLIAGLPPGESVGASPGWAVVSLLIGGATGGGLAWAGPLVVDRWGAACGGVAAVAGLMLLHITGLAALTGAVAAAASLLIAVSFLFFGSFGLLMGMRLGDLSIVASRRSIAMRERFRIIAEALPIPILLTTADSDRLIFTNQRNDEQFFPAGAARNGHLTDAFFADPDEQRRLLEILKRDGAVENYEVEMRRANGSTFWALMAARIITFSGEPAMLAGYYDISDRKAAEEALLDSEVRYALISRAANDGIWDWDLPSGKVYYSSRWKEIVGIDSNQRISDVEDWLTRVHPEDVERLRGEIADHIAGKTPQLDSEYRIRHGDGRYCWMQCRAIALRNNLGEPIRMAGSQSDITLRKTYEINLLNAAYEDRLTGINNRAFFTHLVDTRNTGRSIDRTAILLFNIDEFRRINDSLGSGAGDALLIAVARRLATRVKPEDALSRLGADEFAVWLQDVRDHDAAYQIAEEILSDLAPPYALGDVEMPVGISIGIAAPTLGDAATGTDLLRNARLALDRAKLLGGGRAELFDEALLRETHLRRRLSKDLTNADRLGQIFFEYQPVVSLDPDGTNRIAGFETLMRWRHPELGLIPPARFIPIAEEAGLIGPLGIFAIECASEQVRRWIDLGLVSKGFRIAVNLSTRQISDRAGVMRLHALLDRLPVSPDWLTLEITESVLMSDPEAMATTLQDLRDRGLELSLDDFGTGYSSLSYLHRFPLDVLKIDRSFVTRMIRSPEALRLVRSIIELAHDLGLEVVAEGVESAEEAERLRELGCDHAQGYFFSRPVPSEQAEVLLMKRKI
jgi:diguanylate cyclase (GGDEF)-like protein/PAS domain S-box-containing protein